MPLENSENARRAQVAPVPRWKRVLGNMALVLFGLAVGFAICEIAITVYEDQLLRESGIDPYWNPEVDDSVMHIDLDDPTRWERFEWDEEGNNIVHVHSDNPVLVYELRAGSHVGTGMQINEAGFRDDPFTKAKAPGTYRIAVVGDSVTFGWNLVHEELYTEVLEAMLNDQFDRTYEVYNFAVDGYNAEQELELIKTRVLPYNPDIILVGYVANDHLIGADAGLWRHFSRGWSRTIDFLKLQWRRFIDKYIIQKDMFTQSYEGMAEVSEAHDIPLAVVCFPHETGQEYVDVTVQWIDGELGLPVLDLTPVYEEAGTVKELFFDGVHPNAKGHRLAAEAIFNFLRTEKLIPDA
ncbi:MAG: SGNH/GDSL hydrolase family protein [Candidatus Hydrogenedentota bacterium]